MDPLTAYDDFRALLADPATVEQALELAAVELQIRAEIAYIDWQNKVRRTAADDPDFRAILEEDGFPF